MNNRISLSFVTLTCLSLFACSPSQAQDSQNRSGATVRVDNLVENQMITENVPTQFRIVASDDVDSVKVFSNGSLLGEADKVTTARVLGFNFGHSFDKLGEQDITFEAYDKDAVGPLASQTVRINVVPQGAAVPSRYFNKYILKAVASLTKNYGLLGYDITKQLTHPHDYNKLGTLNPTGNGLTMCVSGSLEVIITALEIYAQETGDKKVYSFLPFDSWNTLRDTNIKAHIWVNSKLNSYGTGDAIAKFGIGENVKFQNLEPGSFININRTTGSGHSVTFLSFIDIKGQDLPKYSDKVAGFRYFGAQGRRIKGQGGYSYRHAFFAKSGCPEVPYQRDCNVIFSDSQKLLNTGMMLDPADWKKKTLTDEDLRAGEPLTAEEEADFHPPSEFNGLTTDD